MIAAVVKGALACVTGLIFCHQTGGPITGRAYNRDFTVCQRNEASGRVKVRCNIV